MVGNQSNHLCNRLVLMSEQLSPVSQCLLKLNW